MTCPKCHSEFDGANAVCPECGVRLLHHVSGVMKTSAVMIAARGEQGFYRSVQDVPEPLRTQLLETTTSSNSGVIVIADRAGKKQLTEVMARRETGGEEVPPGRYGPRENAIPDTPDSKTLPHAAGLPWLAWAGFFLVLALAAIIYAIFQTNGAIFHFRW
jgi:hypothetical protein